MLRKLCQKHYLGRYSGCCFDHPMDSRPASTHIIELSVHPMRGPNFGCLILTTLELNDFNTVLYKFQDIATYIQEGHKHTFNKGTLVVRSLRNKEINKQSNIYEIKMYQTYSRKSALLFKRCMPHSDHLNKSCCVVSNRDFFNMEFFIKLSCKSTVILYI